MMAAALFFLASLCAFCGVVGFLLIVKGSSE